MTIFNPKGIIKKSSEYPSPKRWLIRLWRLIWFVPVVVLLVGVVACLLLSLVFILFAGFAVSAFGWSKPLGAHFVESMLKTFFKP